MKYRMIGGTLALLAMMASGIAAAQSAERVPLADLEAALRDMDLYYGDVPSAVDCGHAEPGSAAGLICNDAYLKTAELLNTRAAVYMEENATKVELDHAKWRGEIPDECGTEDCIYAAFRQQTDDALGGSSPYYKFHAGR